MQRDTATNMSELRPDEPSICIPRVGPEVTVARVTAVFNAALGAGAVDRVDIVPWRGRSTDGLCRVFVHVVTWPDAPVARAMRQRFLAGKEIKLMHRDPWFWRCARSRVPKPPLAGARPSRMYGSPAPELVAQVAAVTGTG
jgi:hypothetical protein